MNPVALAVLRKPTNGIYCLIACASLLSCGGSESGTNPGPTVERVVVTPPSIAMDIGQTQQLTATVLNTDGSQNTTVAVTWSSSNGTVASVDESGLVTGLAEGSTNITARAAGISSNQVPVDVNDPNPPVSPSDVVATAASDVDIDVEWTDNSGNEDEFKIEREEVEAAVAGAQASQLSEVGTVGANQTSFRDTGLEPRTSYRYVVRACNENGCTPAAGADSEGVATSNDIATDAPLVFDPPPIPDGVVNQPYEFMFTASGGSGEFEFAVPDGSLPSGIDLASTGLLAGTPTEEGEFAFSVQVQSNEQVETAPVALVVTNAPQITNEELVDGVVSQEYSEELAAVGGDGANYSYSITVGTPPAGIEMDVSGVFSGTPSEPGTSVFQVTVSSGGLESSSELSITVNEVLEVVTAEPPSGVQGTPYSATIETIGGATEKTFEVVDGSLPDGLTLDDASGQISGTPETVETQLFTLRVTSADGQVVEIQLSLTIFAPLTISTAVLPDADQGLPYAEQLVASGGDGDYSWSVESGNLPGGMTLSASGLIEGEPTSLGTSEFEVRVEDAFGQGAVTDLSLRVITDVAVSTALIALASVNEAYTFQLQAAGGDGSTYDWSVKAGTLPDGIALAPDGSVTGMPSTAGVFQVEFQANSAGRTGSKILTLTVSSAPSTAYNIRVHGTQSSGAGFISPDLIAALEWAVDRWEEIITGDLGDIGALPAFPSSSCGGNGLLLEGTSIDDIILFFNSESIDGPGGTLAGAAPCLYRSSGSQLTAVGFMVFDSDEAGGDPEGLRQTAFHEIGHALGFNDDDFDFFSLAIGLGGFDPRYIGAEGVSQYNTFGGFFGDEIPLEDEGGAGTRDSHWDEFVFETEIMTGFINSGFMPVSVMSIGAMADLGYEVNLDAADPYSCPGGVCLKAESEPLGWDYVIPTRRYVIDREGTVIRAIEPRRNRE